MTPNVAHELAQFLTGDPLSVEDVVRRIGPVLTDSGIPMALELAPAIAGIRGAKLWRFPETGLPYLLRLEPSVDEAPTLGDLVARFGEYKDVSRNREAPPTVIFRQALRGDRWSVTAIAEHADATGSTANAAITSVALRRDSN